MASPQQPTAGTALRAFWRALMLYLRLTVEQRAHRQRVYEARVALGSAVAAHLRPGEGPPPPILAKLLAKRREALLQLEAVTDGGGSPPGAGGARPGSRQRQAVAQLRMADYKLGGWAKGMYYEQPELQAAQRAVEQAEADARFLAERRAEALAVVRQGPLAPADRDRGRPAGSPPPGVIITRGDEALTDPDGQPVTTSRTDDPDATGWPRAGSTTAAGDDDRGHPADQDTTTADLAAGDLEPGVGDPRDPRELVGQAAHAPATIAWPTPDGPDQSDSFGGRNGLAAASAATATDDRHGGVAAAGLAGRVAGLGDRVRAVADSPAAYQARRFAARLSSLAEPPDERRGGATRFLRPVAAAVALTTALAGCTAIAASAMVGPPLRAAEQNLPNLAALEPLHQAERTQVFDRHGRVIANLKSDQDRVVIPLTRMNWTIQRAVVAAEDERFWQHHGVDERGIVRAAVTNLAQDRTAQGGSTITQQYVRNTYPDLKDDTIARKVKEAALAAQLETQFTKQQILEGYLNRVYFGSGYYGVEAASQGYFGHSAKQLTLAEAALLAGIIRSPNQINPRVAPEESLARRDRVLDRMVHLNLVESHMAAQAKQEPLKLDRRPKGNKDSFFVAFLMDQLVGVAPGGAVSVEESNASGDRRLGATYEERRRQFFEGGLNIYTTYDPEMQEQAEAALDTHIGDAEDASAALVSIDPRTGAIRAMATARNYSEDQYNPAWQGRRSPGSAFKTFVLAAAIQDGISPDSTWEASGLSEGSEVCGIPWAPGNYEGQGSGHMSIRQATAKSINGVYARLMGELCPEKVAALAERLGAPIPERDRGLPAIALGGTSVRVLDMASAYATLAAGGIYRKPWVVDRIVKRSDPHGTPVLTGRSPGRRAISATVAFETSKILESVLQSGTAAGRGLDRPAAGKTGTAQNYSNAWFVGYVPQLSTAVWVGNPREERQFALNGDDTITGGGAPANIWHDFMAPTLEGDQVMEWVPPDEDLDYRIQAPPRPEHHGDDDKGDDKGDDHGGDDDGDEGDGGDGGEDGEGGDGDGGDDGGAPPEGEGGPAPPDDGGGGDPGPGGPPPEGGPPAGAGGGPDGGGPGPAG